MSTPTPFDPPADETHWLDVAEDLSDRFAERAPEIDRDGSLPTQNLKEIHESGLDTILLSKEHGGAGVSNRTFGRAVGTIARGCPSTATIWLMHVGAATTLVALGNPATVEIYAQAWRNGARFANALSEPTSGNQFLMPLQEGIPTEGGWLLSGAKRFVSGCETADHFLVNALVGGEPTFFAVDREEGMSFVDIWDSMGLRGTRSQLISFDGVLLREERRGRPLGLNDPNPIGYGWPWLSIGVAEATFAALLKHARTRTIPSIGGPLANMQWVQFEVADARVALEAARLLAGKTLWLADQGSPETLSSSIEAKLAANEMARQVAGLALRAGGGSAYLKTHPIERHFRDAHSGGLMAYSAEVCRDFIGKQVLGVGAEAGAFG
jgi:alkylation response protein AidB-like acyl-CoA dehydrogenase